MEKAIVEKLVELKLGLKFELSHKGNHRWKSEPIATTQKNSGIFHSFFDTIHIEVFANHVDETNYKYDGWFFLRVSLNWSHRDGGTNGASVELFYHEPTDALMSRDEATAKFE